jgi:antitoxin Phd
MSLWQMQEAKTRLGELIEEACTLGPQIITQGASERAVVLSIEDYHAFMARKPNLIQYLLGGPKVDGFDIASSRDMGREVVL